ncbi:hypothetical protein SBF1_700031 [Candidatus Desulfosporosinus infrequens]|uniref:Uncharacterized protein n=1 Tax=Candidatus Desulfosporosinus infrequens TaxID=2043169 RepID=A0A2U3LPL7_9FIRM|nr:hypothetical protein SBF1_700031 [Candidatus Desulfosporosinus infrequens]
MLGGVLTVPWGLFCQITVKPFTFVCGERFLFFIPVRRKRCCQPPKERFRRNNLNGSIPILKFC